MKKIVLSSLAISALLGTVVAIYANEIDEVIVVEEIVPVTKAKESYFEAMKAYAKKDYQKAKKALEKSKNWIENGLKSADRKTINEFDKLKGDIKRLEDKFVSKFSSPTSDLSSLSMSDYKVTDTFFDEAYLNGQFALTSPSNDQNDTSYNGTLSANYKLRNMTLDYAQDLHIDGSYNIIKTSDKDSDSEDSYNILASGHVDKYP